MTTAFQTAEQHLAELAANRVPARDKPSAFHHGLITTLVADFKTESARVAYLQDYVRELQDKLQKRAATLNDLRVLALDWYHGEDCDGYGCSEETDWPECNCGVGDVLRATIPACKVYVDRDEKRYGLSRIVQP